MTLSKINGTSKDPTRDVAFGGSFYEKECSQGLLRIFSTEKRASKAPSIRKNASKNHLYKKGVCKVL